ncbi:MAG: tetratricopeptide repeat protein [Anaerolineales bacterium]|nr:tetratricopeptide repeat protein [Anaerolineales bacterium]MDW8448115.1 tetratricopeptide repeat protein [Anaerolineales bacterium]
MADDLILRRPLFRERRTPLNPYRLLAWVSLILVALWIYRGIEQGAIRPAFYPTPTPTRTSASYIEEAEAYFMAGKIYDPDPPPPAAPRPDAIDTYQRALEVDPNNAEAWARLARIQTYSSALLSNDPSRLQRLSEARQSIDRAVQLAPDNSTVRAIRAFVLDWYATNPLVGAEERQDLLAEAQTEALQAFQLDQNNALALAFYAEVLLDQQNWSQAEQYAAQAVQLDPNSMDAHRVYGTVLESTAQYNRAIQEYLEAARINPNLTFLYLYIGRNYLRLKLYDQALEFFARAANINAQLGVRNPLPNLEIAKAYAQQGEFFIAARNAEKALSLDPTNSNTYGQLGTIMIRARNFEGAMPVLKCAVRGCSAEENEAAQNLVNEGLLEESVPVEGLPLTNLTVAYYYVEYGTVLAFLSRPNQNFCPEARQVLNEVKERFSYDPIIMSIIADSEGICNRLESGQIFSNPNALGTPTPLPSLETTPTPTP